jgi:Domain of unknown function (DUF4157)
MRTHSHSLDKGPIAAVPGEPDRVRGRRSDVPGVALGRTDVLGPAAGLFGMQRAVGNARVAGMIEEKRSLVLSMVGFGGRVPRDADTSLDMESRLGHDFGDARVHTDLRAYDSLRAVNTHAYTVEPNIVFQCDRCDSIATEGRTMLAHGLTHVVQQHSGPVAGTPIDGT